MSESEKILGMRWIPQDGTKVRDITSGERYCAFCGEEAKGLAIERFGEVFCSEAHAEQFVKEVRAARVQAAAAALRAPEAPTESPQPPAPPGAAPKQQDWKAYLAKGLCWGAPLLALVFLLGGGSAVLGAASGLLPLLALLACPLGMYFMMRSMSKMGNKENPGDKDEMK